METLKMHSLDGVQRNIELIGKLFPNAITEVKRDGKVERAIDFDVLRQELSDSIVEGREERYQFTWPDKKKAMLAANAPITATLRPVVADSVGKDGTPGGFDSENLYIEGDNLEVLKLLQETYLGKVKMIYIDPPYNTGNDFVYNDEFEMRSEEWNQTSGNFDEKGNQLVGKLELNTESNGRFHTDWLNMIYPRLKIAKDLLADDGVISISIDDNEAANLKVVCNEIFGERNFVALITVVVKTEGRRYGYFAKTHENILVYSKNVDFLKLNEIEVAGTDFKYYDSLGGYNLTDLRNQNARAFNSLNRPNLRYPFYVDESSADKNSLCTVSTVPVDGYKEVWAITTNGYKSVWRWGKETAQKELHNLTARKSSDGEYRIYQKYRKLTQTAKTVWMEKEFTSGKGTKELQELLGPGVFDFPKPIALLLQLARICSDENSIILDFFSGSATTAHAVMKLNAEDGGHRKFIMVQLPEKTDEKSEAYKAGYKNICEIGKERIRRAGRKIRNEQLGMSNETNGQLMMDNSSLHIPNSSLDIGFRCLRLDTSNMENVYYTPEEVSQQDMFSLVDNVKEDRTPEDLLFQVMLDLGVLLSSPIEIKEIAGKKVFNVADGFLLVCFDHDVTEETVKAIAQMKPYYAVFRDSSIANDSVATNFDQIFETYSPETVRKVL